MAADREATGELVGPPTDAEHDRAEARAVVLEVVDGVASLRLNRPDALNSMNPQLLREMIVALRQVAADRSAKVLVLSGTGRAFCTGADLKSVLALFDDWPRYVDFLYDLTEVGTLLEELPIPTIARVHGYALAGGLEMLLCCDMAIAAEEARIGDQHSNVGLIAGAGGIPRLVRRVGKSRAMEILYTGKWLSGADAADCGIVLRAVPEDKLDEEIDALTAQLVDKSREGSAYLKRAVLAGLDVPLETALNEERAALLEYFSTSPHPREGISAFIGKRKPNFQ